jgi:hypothetical protein
VQFDRAQTSAGRQIDDQKLPIAVRQLKPDHEAVPTGRHGLDAGAARDIDWPSETLWGFCRCRAAVRYSADNDDDEGSETANNHDPHHDNKNFERAHGLKNKCAAE